MAPFLRLKYERLRRKLTQLDLAHLTGIPQPHISYMELGRMNPTEEQLVRLANALLISPPSVLMKPCLIADPEPEANDTPSEVGA